MEESRRPGMNSMKEYYDRRAPEYDATSWLAYGEQTDEALRLGEVLGSLPAARTLDVAVGTGFISRHLRGDLTCVDQSEAMVAVARERLPRAQWCVADGLSLPFRDGSFERVFTSHFYGHLLEDERVRFLAEARRLATEIVVVDSAWADGPEAPPRELWQERQLRDGSSYRIWKRHFSPDDLVTEIGGRIIFSDSTFVAVISGERV